MSRPGGVRSVLAGGLPAQGHPVGWAAGQVALAGGIALPASALVYLVLATGRLHVPYWQLWLLLTAGLLLQWLLRTVDQPPPLPAPVAQGQAADRAGPGHRPFPQAERWQRRLATTSGDPDWYARVVQERLAALVAGRLRQRHGVRLAAEPARARQLLGDELYEFLTAPPTRTPSPAELDRLVTRMEEI